MKKILLILFAIGIVFTGCSVSSNVEEVDALIKKKEFEKAIDKIKEYNLVSKDLKNPTYDYKQLVLTNKVNGLIESKKYVEAVELIEENNLLSKKLINNKKDFTKVKNHALLDEYRQEYQKKDIPLDTLKKINEKIETVEDEEIKKEFIKLINNLIVKVIENSTDYEDLKSLNQYERYLNEEVKNKLSLSISQNTPIEVKVENAGYTIEYLSKYKNIFIGKYRMDIDNFEDYKFMCSQPCRFAVLSNRVVEFTNLTVHKIFVIKDKNKQIANPFDVDELVNVAIKDHENESNEQKEMYKQFETEQKEQSTIRLGMTEDEVLSRWGEPEDINTTITEYSTSEQWVYSNYQYLYFDDGILTSIQQ